MNKELHTLSSHEPKFQELKLQVLCFCSVYFFFFLMKPGEIAYTPLNIRESAHISLFALSTGLP